MVYYNLIFNIKKQYKNKCKKAFLNTYSHIKYFI